MWQGRQPRLVREGFINIREKTFGPLDDDLSGKSADFEILNGIVDVYYDRELRHRFDFETSAALPLDDIE